MARLVLGLEDPNSMSSALPANESQPLNLEIAGIPFSVQSESSQQGKWIGIGCRRFVTPKVPQLRLAISTSSWKRSRRASREALLWEGNRWILDAMNFRVQEAETGRLYLAEISPRGGWGDLLRTWFSLVLLQRGGLLLHAAAVTRNGRALIFCGPSGSGKTTLARLAESQDLLSDESVAVQRDKRNDAGYEAYATPFYGELSEIAERPSAPLGEIFLIRPPEARPKQLFRISQVSPGEAMGELLAQTFLRTLTQPLLEKALPLLEDLVRSVRIRRLQFTPSPELWSFIDDQSG